MWPILGHFSLQHSSSDGKHREAAEVTEDKACVASEMNAFPWPESDFYREREQALLDAYISRLRLLQMQNE